MGERTALKVKVKGSCPSARWTFFTDTVLWHLMHSQHHLCLILGPFIPQRNPVASVSLPPLPQPPNHESPFFLRGFACSGHLV